MRVDKNLPVFPRAHEPEWRSVDVELMVIWTELTSDENSQYSPVLCTKNISTPLAFKRKSLTKLFKFLPLKYSFVPSRVNLLKILSLAEMFANQANSRVRQLTSEAQVRTEALCFRREIFGSRRKFWREMAKNHLESWKWPGFLVANFPLSEELNY